LHVPPNPPLLPPLLPPSLTDTSRIQQANPPTHYPITPPIPRTLDGRPDSFTAHHSQLTRGPSRQLGNHDQQPSKRRCVNATSSTDTRTPKYTSASNHEEHPRTIQRASPQKKTAPPHEHPRSLDPLSDEPRQNQSSCSSIGSRAPAHQYHSRRPTPHPAAALTHAHDSQHQQPPANNQPTITNDNPKHLAYPKRQLESRRTGDNLHRQPSSTTDARQTTSITHAFSQRVSDLPPPTADPQSRQTKPQTCSPTHSPRQRNDNV
jgi:hypothetical protein